MVLTDFMVKSMLWRTETRRCHPETAWHRELEDLNLNPSPTLTHNFKALNLWIIFDKDKVHKIYLKESSENSLGYPLNPLLGRPLSQDMELVFASQLQVRYRLWQDVASPEDGRCMSSWEWEGWRIKLQYSFLTPTEALLGPLSGALAHVTKRGNPAQPSCWTKRCKAKAKMASPSNSERHHTVFICFVDFCWTYSPFFHLTQRSLGTSLAEGMGEKD